MNVLRVTVLLFTFAVAVSRAADTNALPTTITIDGVTYQDVRWGTVTPTSVTVFHRSGITTIPLWKLPPDLQKKFGYDPQKAVAWQKVEQQRAVQQQRMVAMQRLSKTVLAEPFRVGMVGVSRNGEIHVIQVAGPMDMRAHISTEVPKFLGISGGVVAAPDGTPVEVQGGPMYSTTEKESKRQEVWITGLSTEGLVDGVEITRNVIFKITGTKTYPTAMGGSRTLFLLEPMTP